MRKVIIDKKNINKIHLNSAALSFYTLTSISSLFIIVNFLLNSFDDNFKLTVIYDLIQILGVTFEGFVNKVLLENQSINIILLINLVLSSSYIINCYNKYCDFLYYDKIKRKIFHQRISSILMFLMLLIILIFSLIILIYGNVITNLLFENMIFSKFISSILEISVFYLMITLVLIYFPPIKIRFKNIKKESIIITLIIYFIFKTFIIVFDILYNKLKIIGLIFVFTLINYLIYCIHFLICISLFIISKKRNEYKEGLE